MKIKIKVQRHLAVGHIAEDNGDWVFTVCRSGFSRLLGRKLRPGDEVVVELAANIEEDDDEQLDEEDWGWINRWSRELEIQRRDATAFLNRCDPVKGTPETD